VPVANAPFRAAWAAARAAEMVLGVRLAVASRWNDYTSATGEDVRRLRDEFWSGMDSEERQTVLLAEGCVAASAGNRESGM